MDENVFISSGGIDGGNKDADIRLKHKENFRYNFYEMVGDQNKKYEFNSEFKFAINANIGLWITSSKQLTIPKMILNQGFNIPEGGKITIYFRADGINDDDGKIPRGEDVCNWLNSHTIIESSTSFDPKNIEIRIFHKIHCDFKYETKYEEIGGKFCYTFRITELPETLPYHALITYTETIDQQPSSDLFSWPNSVVQKSDGESSLIEAINSLDKNVERVAILLDVETTYQTVLKINSLNRKFKQLMINTTESRPLKVEYTADSIEKLDSLEFYGPLVLDLTAAAKDNTNSLNMQFKRVVMHKCSLTELTKALKIKFGAFVGITEDTYKLISKESTLVDINLTFTKNIKVIEFKDDKIELNVDPNLDPPEIIDIVTSDKISGEINFIPNFSEMSLTLVNSKSSTKNTFGSINIRDPSRKKDIGAIPPTVTFSGDLWDTAVFSSPFGIISNKKVVINNFPTEATLQNMYHQRTPDAIITTKSDIIKLDGSKLYKDDHIVEIEAGKSVHFDNLLFDGKWPNIDIRYHSSGEGDKILDVDKIKITNTSTGRTHNTIVNKAIEIDKKGKLVSDSLTINEDTEIIFNVGDDCYEVPYIKSGTITGKPKTIKINYIGEKKSDEEINKIYIEETPIVVSRNIQKEDVEIWKNLVSGDSVAEKLQFTYDICVNDHLPDTKAIYVSGYLKVPPPPPPPPQQDENESSDESSESSDESSESEDEGGEQIPNEEDIPDSKGDNQGGGDVKLNGGYIALIVISCIVVVALIIVGVYFFVFRKKKDEDSNNVEENAKNNDNSSSDNEGTKV